MHEALGVGEARHVGHRRGDHVGHHVADAQPQAGRVAGALEVARQAGRRVERRSVAGRPGPLRRLARTGGGRGESGEFADIVYEKADGIARVTINRPSRRNAFTPDTVAELLKAFADARDDASIGVVLLRGANPQHDGKFAFCAGGDQKIRGDKKGGYMGQDGIPRLNVLDLQKLIRSMPKVVIALVAGYAIGGGHVLHVVCDLTLASREHARFRQTDADVVVFDPATVAPGPLRRVAKGAWMKRRVFD